ncbi:SNF1-related protein kinase catalytic subunit alpha [Wickerhamomyces ciferrii]|uniref:non-specific serine/threonine protein kinase n=1 Tax=Wickerhamomyces ciferrii (strain ATCC 14091 / BCRC 22168 / CBS 111 / JCM 3599 / NBRC 0793 / NRRL Y-1031 F-60-10) TaxID=1206466 RepID=K0KSR7_WICCF|nr:SNF1-related protein kinase catalytic subunit alpha [Wickerhamomyces ciferrii]CCH45092.1 SNF1-related protein kinase catalytic subunit alpha [Wickerhamomyces ciferrii]
MSFLLDCFPCFSSQPELRINKSKFKILKLLGEGGFSYVYLVEASNGAHYALKKIRCPFGAESVKIAMTEVENYKEFHSPYIIRAIDSNIIQEDDGSKTVYILLPFFESSLQDIINSNVINDTKMDEVEVIRIFIGICRGLQNMHRHHISVNKHPTLTDLDSNNIDEGDEQDNLLLDNDDDDGESEIDTLPGLVNSGNNQGNDEDDDEFNDATELTSTIAYAHKDIKPSNVMLSKDGLPVLVDLGSCSKARVKAKTRSAAIAIQELAAEHCTLPYRAPELLDVKTGSKIDEKIDIWSLGCTLYALLYGCSPFEYEENENGASITLAISNGTLNFPKKGDLYSDELKSLIKMCIVIDPEERPSIEDVLSRALEVQSRIG